MRMGNAGPLHVTLRIVRVMIRDDAARPLTKLVSAVSPLDGDAIDGAARPKLRRAPKPRREPQDRSLTFFCSNPQCDHATWSPVEQARHMAREFHDIVRVLVRLAPDSAEALKLTGGVIARNLTDEECRAACAEHEYLRRRGLPDPLIVMIKRAEYQRRQSAGILSPAPKERNFRWHPPEMCRSGRHPLSGTNVAVRPDGTRRCRACQRESTAAYRAKNPDKVKEWRDRNAASLRETRRPRQSRSSRTETMST